MTASTAGWLCGSCGHTEAGDHGQLAAAMAAAPGGAVAQAQAVPAQPASPGQQLASGQTYPAPAPSPAAAKPHGPINVEVDTSIWHYLGVKAPLFVLGWIASAVWAVFGMYIESQSHSHSSNGDQIWFLPIILMFVWVAAIRKGILIRMLELFAQANGFSFQKDGVVDRTYGNLFRLAGRGSVSDLVNGNYDGRAISFFVYDRIVQQGRNTATYRYSILDLALPALTPHILIRHKSRLGQWDAVATQDLAQLQLEGDFNDKLEVWVAKGNEVQALTVLTPDVMAVIADHIERYDIEFVADRFYAYLNGYIKASQDISGMIELADMVLDEVVPVLQRNHDTSSLVVPPPGAGLELRTAGSGVTVAVIIGAIVFFSVITLTLVLAFVSH